MNFVFIVYGLYDENGKTECDILLATGDESRAKDEKRIAELGGMYHSVYISCPDII